MKAVTTRSLKHRCSVCGIAIQSHEIAYEITGQSIDYIEHEPGMINLLLCVGCREKILHNLTLDQGTAIMFRKALEADGAAKKPEPVDTSHAEPEFLADHPFGIDPPDGTGVGI
jgi:hypothetical protein